MGYNILFNGTRHSIQYVQHFNEATYQRIQCIEKYKTETEM